MGPTREELGYRPVNNHVLPEQKNLNQRLQSHLILPQSPQQLSQQSQPQLQPQHQSQSQPLRQSQSQPLPQIRHSQASIHAGNQIWPGQNYSMINHYPQNNYMPAYPGNYNQAPGNALSPLQHPQQQSQSTYPAYINRPLPSQNQFYTHSHPSWNNTPSQQQQNLTQSTHNRYISNQNLYGYSPNQYNGNFSNMPNYMNGPQNPYPNSNMMNHQPVDGNWWNRSNEINNYTSNWGNTPAPNSWNANRASWSNVALNPADNGWQGNVNDANNANFSSSGEENAGPRSSSRTTVRPVASRTSVARRVNQTPVSDTSTNPTSS